MKTQKRHLAAHKVSGPVSRTKQAVRVAIPGFVEVRAAKTALRQAKGQVVAVKEHVNKYAGGKSVRKKAK